MVVPYNRLLADLEGVFQDVVDFADLEPSEALCEHVRETSRRQPGHKASHRKLRLEAFGLKPEEVLSDLREVFAHHGFSTEPPRRVRASPRRMGAGTGPPGRWGRASTWFRRRRRCTPVGSTPTPTGFPTTAVLVGPRRRLARSWETISGRSGGSAGGGRAGSGSTLVWSEYPEQSAAARTGVLQ